MSWSRVSARKRCAICDKPDWCSFTADGAARCMRVDVAPPGWRCIKTHDDGGHTYRPEGEKQTTYEPRRTAPRKLPDFGTVHGKCFSDCSYEMAQKLADRLGIKKGSTLSAMGLGWHTSLEVWTFPMYADPDHVIGLRTRADDGSKRAVRGSASGLFMVPADLEYWGTPILVCEGPTDTAVANELGFTAVGRPSCTGGKPFLVKLLTDRDVVIVSDSDSPGRKGAEDLASALHRRASSVKVIEPPAKDIRKWYGRGATEQSLQFLIDAARVRNG